MLIPWAWNNVHGHVHHTLDIHMGSLPFSFVCDKSMHMTHLHMGGSWTCHAYTWRCHSLLHGQQNVTYIEHGHEKMVMHLHRWFSSQRAWPMRMRSRSWRCIRSLYPQMPFQCTWSWACLNACMYMAIHGHGLMGLCSRKTDG